LKLEVTESVLMVNGISTLATLKQLKSIRVKLAIDDFGTGYSSLAYLKRFPFDCLKIDRSFIMKLGQEPEEAAIVSAIMDMARTLDLKVTSEGVETSEQINLLRAMRCDRLQGYFFARPLSALAWEDILANPEADLGGANATPSSKYAA
jgi:EAL domain-containing protein (putative c-di-GMP-specific phosphodiesterase class I)